jgi:hypothetical protein
MKEEYAMEELRKVLSTIIIDYYVKLKQSRPDLLDVEARVEIAKILVDILKYLVDNCGTDDEKDELIEEIYRMVEEPFVE